MGTHPIGVRESDAEEGQGNLEGRSSILVEESSGKNTFILTLFKEQLASVSSFILRGWDFMAQG